MQEVVKKEVGEIVDKIALSNTASLARQQQVPIASYCVVLYFMQELKSNINALLADKMIEKAFNLALSTSDLNLVAYVCENVSPEEVFDGNSQCPLSQPVLLSLIQQLSVDLTDNTDLKIRYT